MNSRKKIISLLMVLVLTFAFSVNVFASENDIPAPPENVEKHTIELTVDPAENVGIQPYIWNQENFTVSNVTCSGQFLIPDRYFAYEFSATSTNGSTSGRFTVKLLDSSLSEITTMGNVTSGEMEKNDWISVFPNENYLFKIINYTNTQIKVHIIYYSWT